MIDDLEYAFCDRLTQEIKEKEAQQSGEAIPTTKSVKKMESEPAREERKFSFEKMPSRCECGAGGDKRQALGRGERKAAGGRPDKAC